MHVRFVEADEKFIKAQVQGGYYTNETELVRDAVRRMREDKERTRRFQEAVAKGIQAVECGETVVLTPALLREIKQEAVKMPKPANLTAMTMPYQKPLRLEISAPARNDLRDIAQYTFANYGEQQMDVYLQSLYDGMQLLTENPKIGHHRDDIPIAYKTLSVEKHVLVFTVKDNAVVIARILHQSRGNKAYLL